MVEKVKLYTDAEKSMALIVFKPITAAILPLHLTLSTHSAFP